MLKSLKVVGLLATTWGCYHLNAWADVTFSKRAMQPIDATVVPNAAATAITPAAPAALPAMQAPVSLPADTAVKPATHAPLPTKSIPIIIPGSDSAAITTCVNGASPVIQSVLGYVSPGRTITVNGSCFGPSPGDLNIIYKEGCITRHLLAPSRIQSWSNTSLVVFIDYSVDEEQIPACEVALMARTKKPDNTASQLFSARYYPKSSYFPPRKE